MGWISGIVVFILIWWVVFFMTLPMRIKRNDGDVGGVPAGAPEKPYIKFKLLLTTAVTIFLWVVFYALIETGVLTYEIFI